jgi:hypothetical protein
MAPTSAVVKKAAKAKVPRISKVLKKAADPKVEIIEAPKEKRLRKFKKHPGTDVLERIYRALSQRLYLIDQEDVSSSGGGLGRKFAVLGSTGNVYDVKIGQQPTCTCPDCARGKLCKHIIFILVKVLHVPRDSELVYQNALLQSELKQIFDNAPRAGADVVAKVEVVSAYKRTVGEEEQVEEKVEVVVVNEKVPEGDCPICFESITTSEVLDSCAGCRNYFHKDCLKNWLAVKQTCCYCRALWRSFGAPESAAVVGPSVQRDEGYLNLGTQQGLSGRRDTSTYNHWRSGHYGYGYSQGSGVY